MSLDELIFGEDDDGTGDVIKLPKETYYYLMGSVSLPVFLFFSLWAWLGWRLFVNN